MKEIAKTIAATLIAAGAFVAAHPAFAASKTTTLAVSNMTCSACPITVRKALLGVHGVEKVEFNLDKKEAVVTFDEARTNVKALTKATENAGYPSHVSGGQ